MRLAEASAEGRWLAIQEEVDVVLFVIVDFAYGILERSAKTELQEQTMKFPAPWRGEFHKLNSIQAQRIRMHSIT